MLSAKARKIANEPDWLTGNISSYAPVASKTDNDPKKIQIDTQGPLQQSDLLKPVYMDVVNFGLNYAYNKYKDAPFKAHDNDPNQLKYSKTDKPRKVIIVGAGMAGLSAAYELAQTGHDVQIIEMQERFGGRVKTFGEKQGFAKHLYVDGV